MQVGVLKEIKRKENRVAMTPAGVEQMVARGHDLLVETTAGEGSGFPDETYARAGAVIADSPRAVYAACEMVMKVKEPLPVEYGMIRPGQILFTYFHFAASEELTRAIMASGCVAIAYETVEKANGSLPLLTPMSEVAGRMAIQEGAKYLEKTYGGKGVLLSGVPGVDSGTVVVIGGGIVGTNAAKMACGNGASGGQPVVRHGVLQLDDDRSLAGDIHLQPGVVPVVDHLADDALQPVGPLAVGPPDGQAFGAHAYGRGAVRLVDAVAPGGDDPPPGQRHLAGNPVDMPHPARQHVVFTDEAGDEEVSRLLVDRLRRSDLLQPALVQDGDTVGHDERFVLVVGDIQERGPRGPVNALELVLHLLPQLPVEGSQGLVHENQGRLEDQRPRQGHALLLAARELLGAAVFEALELHQLQDGGGPAADLVPGQLAPPQGEGDVLGDALVGEKGVILENDPDVAPKRRNAAQGLSFQADIASGGVFETRQHHEDGGFA